MNTVYDYIKKKFTTELTREDNIYKTTIAELEIEFYLDNSTDDPCAYIFKESESKYVISVTRYTFSDYYGSIHPIQKKIELVLNIILNDENEDLFKLDGHYYGLCVDRKNKTTPVLTMKKDPRYNYGEHFFNKYYVFENDGEYCERKYPNMIWNTKEFEETINNFIDGLLSKE